MRKLKDDLSINFYDTICVNEKINLEALFAALLLNHYTATDRASTHRTLGGARVVPTKQI